MGNKRQNKNAEMERKTGREKRKKEDRRGETELQGAIHINKDGKQG
jgi:hypothetical protein